MPIQAAILQPTGLEILTTQAETFAEQATPEGVYTIARTFQRDSALLLESHLDRLEESARLENISLKLNRASLRAALRTLIQQSGNSESRFRITIPRETPEAIYLAVEPLHPVPPEVRQNGIPVATIQAYRHNPSAKTTLWQTQRKTALAELGKEIYEGILLDEQGFLLEGTSSNFYAILDGELRTAEQGILKGISRKTLLASIGDLIPLGLDPIHINDLPRLSEAFLTSSSRGVLPIVQINEISIADGTPQPITLALAKRYDDWTNKHLEPI